MSSVADDLVLGESLSALIAEHGQWSQATFGTDDERGPTGPLKHLEKEAKEAYMAWGSIGLDGAPINIGTSQYREEMADCLLLLLDAARRSGIGVKYLIEAAQEKLVKNKIRVWPKPVKDMPVEHVRSEQPASNEPIETGGAYHEIDDETGNPYWRLWGADWKDSEEMDVNEAMQLDPRSFPPGTRVVIIEPDIDDPRSVSFYASCGVEKEGQEYYPLSDDEVEEVLELNAKDKAP